MGRESPLCWRGDEFTPFKNAIDVALTAFFFQQRPNYYRCCLRPDCENSRATEKGRACPGRLDKSSDAIAVVIGLVLRTTGGQELLRDLGFRRDIRDMRTLVQFMFDEPQMAGAGGTDDGILTRRCVGE